MLCAQIERCGQIIERRKQIFTEYRKKFLNIPGIGFQPISLWAEPAPWLFCITVEEKAYGRSRDELMS